MVTLIQPDNRLAAVFLKGHLKMLALGMKNSKLSGTQILKAASQITGKKYKRGQYKLALADIEEFLS
ncbi:MAG: hypothetical protein Unbinned200contig1000_62 [Prokaryotic dsDNA virus sp.]|nr:MAG: hypothetical protein Unbinned200contig1000_62 [Prokaryotic dsDNA virus sp.]